RDDYANWAAQNPEYKIWDYDQCLEAFKVVENYARKNPDEEFKKYHGFNGLLHYKTVQTILMRLQKISLRLQKILEFLIITILMVLDKWNRNISDALKTVETYPPLLPLSPWPVTLQNCQILLLTY
ncbi:3879_t:CDS:2, partial [Funneliformis geosporum]